MVHSSYILSAKVTFIERISRDAPPLVRLVFLFWLWAWFLVANLNSNGFPVNFYALNIFWFYQSMNFYKEKNTNKVEAPEFWCPCTRTLVPFQDGLQIFCFNKHRLWKPFSLFFSHLFRLDLTFLTKHYQHEKEFTNKIFTKKSIGAPYLEIWIYGDLSLVPRHQNLVVRLLI